jgi:2-polyprenyl-3-methyl-5-hydroxy-6-metoxy-1,4-benzoquinol methylase
VLDLAAGTGALLARLGDLGFDDLNAVELDVPVFKLAGVMPVAVDLNTDFSDDLGRTFDLVTAVEIIEHLDSPRHFLGQIWKLLKPGGHLVVTTPNIAHWMGRIWFLLGGELRYFKENDYHHQRHISPINHTHMRLTLREVGFEIVDSGTAGSFYGPLKRLVTAPVSGLFRLAQGPVTGDTIIYLARKTNPDRTSPGRNSDVYVRRYHTATTDS